MSRGARQVPRVSSTDNQQPISRIRRYRFDASAQAFLLTEDSAAEITVTNTTSREVNGNVSSLDALKQNPGADDISLPGVLQAINNTPTTVDVLVTWLPSGTLACSSVKGYAMADLKRGSIMVDRDVDGDGLSDVTLDISAVMGIHPTLFISASNTTVRHLRVLGNGSQSPIQVQADVQPGTAIANIALIGIEVASPSQMGFLPTIGLYVSPTGGQTSSPNDVLVSGRQFSGGQIAAAVVNNNGSGMGELHRETLVENVGTTPDIEISITAGGNINKALLTQIIVANNKVHDVDFGIVFWEGSEPGPTTENTIEGAISGNVISKVRSAGISVTGGMTFQGASTANTEVIDIEENYIDATMTPFDGIIVLGGNGTSLDTNSPITNNMVTATIAENEVQNSQATALP